MGGEQSREVIGNGNSVVASRLASVGSADSPHPPPLVSSSPRPSISSDADLPYISYTVNRPIGDSPKRTNNRIRGLRSGGGGSPRKSRRRVQRPPEVVVVREAANNDGVVDPELATLQNIQTFLPIIRGALTAPSARDPEVLERLDSGPLISMCKRYQAHLHQTAAATQIHQNAINDKIKEVDATASLLVSTIVERQKAFAKYADKLSQVNEVSQALTRCHSSLNLILESLDTLNEFLPIHERLEPFVWTTG